MSFNIGSEPDGLEGRAALMLLVTKPKIHIQTYIRTSAYVERTTKLDPEPQGWGNTATHGTPGDVHVPSPRGSGDHR